MIVKDEGHIVSRAIRSALPLTDCWLIVDTGSTDNTCEIIRRELSGKQGRLLRRDWKGFAESRNDALRAAREMAGYVLFLDADDFLVGAARQSRQELSLSPLWNCWAYDGWVRHNRVCAVKSEIQTRWVGERHEYLECDENAQIETPVLSSLSIRYMHEGARSREVQTLDHDSVSLDAMIESSAVNSPQRARAFFYRARTAHAQNHMEEAISYYEHRAAIVVGDEEERWFASFEACRLSESHDSAPDLVLSRMAKISLERPSRAEPLMEMARLLRCAGALDHALELAHHCVNMAIPKDGIFVDLSCHFWRAWDEICTIHLLSGRWADAWEPGRRALSFPGVPTRDRERILTNLKVCRSRCA